MNTDVKPMTMNIPFLDLKANYLTVKDEILKEWEDVLENTYYILGPKVVAFEEAFARAHNAKHALGLSTGTDGNHMALWSLGIGHGDEVIVPANTFIATAWGATLCGATPVFVDCEADSYNIDPEKLEESFTEKTKAVVVVHLYGQPADMDRIKAVCDKHNVAVVEDCAQAHLAEYKGHKVGTIGKSGSFSFYPGKNLGAYGEGGALITNDEDIFKKVDMFRNQGQSKKYYHDVYGHNYRLEALQGAVLGVKLRYLQGWIDARRNVAAYYDAHLADIAELTLPKAMDYARHTYHLYVLQHAKRDELGSYLGDHGVASGLHYPVPLHMQKCFSDLGYKQGQFPESEKLGANCLSLPMYPEMTEEQMAYVVRNVRAYFGK